MKFWSWLEVSLVMLVVTVAITGEILPKSKATEETSDQQVEKESKKLTFKHVIQVFWFCLLGYVSQSSFPYCLHVCVRVLSLAPDRNLINAGLSQPLMEFTIYIALFFSAFQLQENHTLPCLDCYSLTPLWTLSMWSRKTSPLAHQLTLRDKAFTSLRRSRKSGEKRPCSSLETLDSRMVEKSHLKLDYSKMQTEAFFPTGNKQGVKHCSIQRLPIFGRAAQ